MENKRALDWAIMEVLLSKSQLRQLHMLHHIPDAPETITTQKLLEKLTRDGFKISLRGVQRDLAALKQKGFPLVMKEDETLRQYHWGWEV